MNKQDEVFLKDYDDSKYEKPSATADIAIFTTQEQKLKLLLIERGNSPFVGSYALPGGFVNKGESVDDAARRELKEETGVSCDCLEQVRVFSEPGRDPRRWVITTAFLAMVDSSEICVEAGDDAKKAEWFDVSMEQNDKGNWELELLNGEIRIQAVLGERERSASWMNTELYLISSENVAFDHGLIIGYAALRLREWMKQ